MPDTNPGNTDRTALMTHDQNPLGYFGPEGTFTHEAACLFARAGSSLIPYDPIERVYDALVTGEVKRSVVPLESSSEGYVPSSLRSLWRLRGSLYLIGHLDIPVTFSLYRKPTDESPITRLIGHPMALRQIERWITARNIPTAEADSSIRGLIIAAQGEDGLCAVGPPGRGAQFGLEEIETTLEGDQPNRTRFVLLSCDTPQSDGTRICTLNRNPIEMGAALKAAGIAPLQLQLAPIKTGRRFGEYGYFCEWDLAAPAHAEEARQVIATCRDTWFVGLLKDMARH